MYEGSNPSALRSQRELACALLRLLRREPFARVTITMICQEAKVSRQTFYQVFGTKDDVIRHLIMQEYAAFEREMSAYDALSFQRFAEHTFAFFDQNEAFIDLLARNDLHYLLQEQFQIALGKILAQFRCESEALLDDMNRTFIAGGLCAMLLYRPERGQRLSARERAERFADLFTIRQFVRVQET